MSNEVVCNHCGSKVSLKGAYETVWDLENGDSLNWYYCDRCEKMYFLVEERKMKIKHWKIRCKETGLFSKGGTRTDHYLWTKNGKSWSNIGGLKNHLNQFIDYDGNLKKDYPYHNAEIVEVEVDYDDCFVMPVIDMVETIQENKAKQEEKRQQSWEKWNRERELAELERLKNIYE